MNLPSTALDIDLLRTWVGRSESLNDLITQAPLTALAATLDRDDVPTDVPPLYHWLYFLPVVPMAGVGPDGHPARGGFLPPVPLPRRMWAASRLRFHAPLSVGEAVTRRTEIADVQCKQGKSGSLVFVTLRHAVVSSRGVIAVTEEQDIVYRGDPQPATPAATPAAPGVPRTKTEPVVQDALWRRHIRPDPVLLFRYSALTFNGHRIHYDRPYATGVEGYPGLVVHGPLIATLLVDHLRRNAPGAQLVSFEFRALRPAFEGAPLVLNGQPAPDGRSVRLWASDVQGAVGMEALATLS